MFELFQDRRKEWRFRFRAVNGRIIFISSEGYKNKSGALRAIEIAKETNSETAMKEV